MGFDIDCLVGLTMRKIRKTSHKARGDGKKMSWARDLKAVQPIKTMNVVTINFRKN